MDFMTKHIVGDAVRSCKDKLTRQFFLDLLRINSDLRLDIIEEIEKNPGLTEEVWDVFFMRRVIYRVYYMKPPLHKEIIYFMDTDAEELDPIDHIESIANGSVVYKRLTYDKDHDLEEYMLSKFTKPKWVWPYVDAWNEERDLEERDLTGLIRRYSGDKPPKADILLFYGMSGLFGGSTKLCIREELSKIDGVTIYDDVDDGDPDCTYFGVEQKALIPLSEKFVVALKNVDEKTMLSMKEEFERRKSMGDKHVAEKWFTI